MPKMLELHGAMVALVTPFRGEEVDYDALGRIIEFQIENGIQGLVPCGTTGESPTLSHEEHDRVIAFTVEAAAKRVPVIAGTGSNSTAEAVRLTERAAAAGADACLIVNPYYNKPTQHGMYAHVGELAKIGLPIVLYNIPGRCGIELTAATIARCYEDYEPVVAVKEATGKIDVSSEIASLCGINILSGDDSLTLPIGAVGGKGVISVLANLLPAQIRALTDAIAAGDLHTARQRHGELFGLFRGMFVETNPIPIKAAMAMAGWCENQLRLPLSPLSEDLRAPLAAKIREIGVKIRE
jgi:4-hydroxy-tetrahydrodipicolinate synthase